MSTVRQRRGREERTEISKEKEQQVTEMRKNQSPKNNREKKETRDRSVFNYETDTDE